MAFFPKAWNLQGVETEPASVVNTYINNLHELEKEPVAHENMAAWVSGQKVSITDDCG